LKSEAEESSEDIFVFVFGFGFFNEEKVIFE